MKKIIFKRINDHFELFITVEPLIKIKERLINVETGIARLTYFESEGIRFYSFGLNTFKNKPGHGGEWSSNSKYINEVFDVDIIECAVKENIPGNDIYCSMACDKKFIKYLAPNTLIYKDGKLFEGDIKYPIPVEYPHCTIIDCKGELLLSNLKP